MNLFVSYLQVTSLSKASQLGKYQSFYYSVEYRTKLSNHIYVEFTNCLKIQFNMKASDFHLENHFELVTITEKIRLHKYKILERILLFYMEQQTCILLQKSIYYTCRASILTHFCHNKWLFLYVFLAPKLGERIFQTQSSRCSEAISSILCIT